jgi:hypothetical protein
MTNTSAVPTWAVPTCHAITDLHWLAYADVVESAAARSRGIVAALEWARGTQDGPVSGRPDHPVTAATAEAELWAATGIVRPGAPAPARTLADELGVEYRPARPVDPVAAEGVRATVSWLLGRTETPPLEIPVRRGDGLLAEPDDVVDIAMAAEPHRTWGPEERHAARAHARATVERSHRLLARIAAAQAATV